MKISWFLNSRHLDLVAAAVELDKIQQPLLDQSPCFFFFTKMPKALTLPLALRTWIWLQSCSACAELAAQQR